ncbi:hypothetical protein QS257_13585 [Terrilactibacillus sp. S3-3]|nr:hypothetical protein QS257_13585 [Terrilactibacillus sp. S3-3]
MNFQPYAISQSQVIGTYQPEHILRGKVLEILPDRTAIVQLGAKRLVAKVDAPDPPLKVGKDYLFQIKRNTDPLLARVLRGGTGAKDSSGQTMADDVLSAFKIKSDPLTRQLVQSFLEHGDPLSKQTILAARSLLKNRASFSEDVKAIRWMIARQLPLEPAVFQSAKALQTKAGLSEKFQTLQNILNEKGTPTAPVAALKDALNRLAANDESARARLPLRLIQSKNGASALVDFLKQTTSAKMTKSEEGAIRQFLQSPRSVKDIGRLLNHWHINQKPEAFLEAFSAFLSAKGKDVLAEKSEQRLIFNTLKQLGFGHEQAIRDALSEGVSLERSHTVKEGLLAVIQDEKAPYQLRQAAGEAVRHITGEQLQMASADPQLAQFALQIPVPYRQRLENLLSLLGRKTESQRAD